MTVLSVTDHDTVRLASKFPAESRRSALNHALSPTARVALSGTIVTVATGAGAVTTTSAEPLLPSLVAVRTVDPGFNARTRGQLSDHAVSMRATVESLSVKLTARPYSGFPCASRSATWKRAVSPTIMVSVEGVTVTEATGGGA